MKKSVYFTHSFCISNKNSQSFFSKNSFVEELPFNHSSVRNFSTTSFKPTISNTYVYGKSKRKKEEHMACTSLTLPSFLIRPTSRQVSSTRNSHVKKTKSKVLFKNFGNIGVPVRKKLAF
jgi:hypothetical protein